MLTNIHCSCKLRSIRIFLVPPRIICIFFSLSYNCLLNSISCLQQGLQSFNSDINGRPTSCFARRFSSSSELVFYENKFRTLEFIRINKCFVAVKTQYIPCFKTFLTLQISLILPYSVWILIKHITYTCIYDNCTK